MSFLLASLGLRLSYDNKKMLLLSLRALLGGIKKLRAILLIIIIVGVLSQLMGIIGSGLPRNDGSLVFHRLQSSDGLMHIAFSQAIKEQFPPHQPGATGLSITNYHYWSNLYVAEISRLFFIPIDLLFFQLLPLLISGLLVGNLILLALDLGANRHTLYWIVFFHFFAGNITYIFGLLMKHDWLWNSPAIDHGMIQFYNPPQTIAKLLLFLGSYFLLDYMKYHRIRTLVAVAVVFATLFGFKVYFGIFGALTLGLWFIHETMIRRHSRSLVQVVVILILYGFLSLAIFLPPNKTAGGLFLAPFAWPKILLGMEYLDFNEWWLRLQVYESFHNTRGIVAMYGLATLIFIIAIGGTRLIGLFSIFQKNSSRIIRDWKLIYYINSIVFFIIGMNFLQISGGANVFNFMILTLIIMGIFSGFAMSWLKLKLPMPVYVIISIIIVLLSIPRPFHELWLLSKSWIHNEGSFLITRSEREALSALKSLPLDTVYQSHPDDLQDFYETPYRTYFSEKQAYLAGSGILRSHNQPIDQRKLEMKTLFSSNSASDFVRLGQGYNITYVFLPKSIVTQMQFDVHAAEKQGLLRTVFANPDFVIYQLLKYN
jgi:hypothetical protein